MPCCASARCTKLHRLPPHAACPPTALPPQEFEFVVSPTGRSQHLKLVLFALSEQGQQYVAAGSLGLDSLLGSDTPHQRVTVPVVDEASFGCCLGWACSHLNIC